jgi:pimeloyl-ACP methyl ester carboxylesterase
VSDLQKSSVVDAVELAYRHRPGTGPSIVFVSGLGESGAVWDDVIDRLPPAWGRSAKPPRRLVVMFNASTPRRCSI